MKLGKIGFENTLLCPSCGEIYLHHEKIQIFDRDDDSKEGLHTTIENRNVKIDSDIRKNPSTRRQGILIHFWCEICNGEAILSISQHKGQTIFEFREAKEDEYMNYPHRFMETEE
jgi:hypothetical protein